MKRSDKAQAALDRVVEQFKAGDLSPLVRIARLQRQGDEIPFDSWSLGNRILAYIQTGTLDCRGYKQWQRAGRHVRKGERAAHILAPCLVPVEDKKTGETLERLAEAWQVAPVTLRAKMLAAIFEEVRVDLARRRLVAVKPWPPFWPLFRMDGPHALTSDKWGLFCFSQFTEASLKLLSAKRNMSRGGRR